MILREKRLSTLLDKTQLRKLASGQSTRLSQNTDVAPAASKYEDLDDKTLDPIQRFPKLIPTAGLPTTFIQAGTAHYTHPIPGAAVQHTTQYCFTDVLPRLKAAFWKAMSGYQAFRLKFEVQTDPLLVKSSLKESFNLNWTEEEVESLEGAELEQPRRTWSVEASTEPIFRVLTPRTAESNRKLSVVHWFFHLSLMDGRSMDILMQQVDALMDDPSLAVEVIDRTFAVVQSLADHQAQHSVAAKSFWATHEISPASRNHPLLQILDTRTPSRVHMSSIEVFYPEDLRAFQSRTGFTFEVLARAAIGLVLAKLQDTSTVSLMSVNSRRSLPIEGIADAVGSFASSMILTLDIDETDAAQDLLEQVFQKLLELDDMSYSDPSDGFSLGGLVVVSSDPYPHLPWYSGGNQTEVMSPKETLPTLYVGPTGRVRFCFNSSWRTVSEMQIMTDIFQTAMISLGSATLNVAECMRLMLPVSQRTKVLGWGNCFSDKTTLTGIEDDITSLFEKQVQSQCSAVALQFRGQQISYQALAGKIQIVGRQLRELLRPGSIVLLHADGSINWVVGMFAIMWADCIFAPQGVNLPHQLRSHHYAIADAQAFLVPQQDTSVPKPDGCQLSLCVETIIEKCAEEQRSRFKKSTRARPKPLAGAYICFSSGTTGQPKAIRCIHSGVVSLLTDHIARLQVGPGLRVAQTLAPAFDGALLEVFAALCYGGTLVLKDPLEPFEHLQAVDSMMVTPSLAEELDPEDYHHLKYIYFAGEVLPQTTADKWSSGQPVTIGKPLSSTRTYILDKQGRPTSPLVAGEIYISGVQVSLGYIGLEEESKYRFIPDHIWPSDGGRMYRTGDRAYWTMDGQIAFIGRTDRQVKLGGYRIDLNDVQARLQAAIASKVRVAAVVVGDTLGCAISEGNGLTPEQVRVAAESALPPQFVPKVIGCLETMPVSPFVDTSLDIDVPETGGELDGTNKLHRLLQLDVAGGAMLDLGIYSVTWIMQVLYHIQREGEKEPPTVVSAVHKYATGVDETATFILHFPSQKAMGVGMTSLRIASGVDYDFTAGPPIRIQGTAGEIQVFGPAFKPRSLRIIAKNGKGAARVETETFPVPKDDDREGWGHGIFWEADECARCIRDGRLESEILPLDETILTMEIMEKILNEGDIRYPDSITSHVYRSS